MKKKSDELINWADFCSLAPFKPDAPTSLRSERIIDYAFSTEIPIRMQTYEGGTTSDHKPIIAVISTKSSALTHGRNIHWKVFSWFLSFVLPFWEKRWNLNSLDLIYNDYTTFLSLLLARCTTYFPLDKYRIAISKELRACL
jgi:hypothetical protein